MPNPQTSHLLNKRKAHNQVAKLPIFLFLCKFFNNFF